MPTSKWIHFWVVPFWIHFLRSAIDSIRERFTSTWINRFESSNNWFVHSNPFRFKFQLFTIDASTCASLLNTMFVFVLVCVCSCVLWTWFHFDLFARIDLFTFTASLRLSSTYCSNCDQENAPTECNPFRLPIIYRAISLVPRRLADLVDPKQYREKERTESLTFFFLVPKRCFWKRKMLFEHTFAQQ